MSGAVVVGNRHAGQAGGLGDGVGQAVVLVATVMVAAGSAGSRPDLPCIAFSQLDAGLGGEWCCNTAPASAGASCVPAVPSGPLSSSCLGE